MRTRAVLISSTVVFLGFAALVIAGNNGTTESNDNDNPRDFNRAVANGERWYLYNHGQDQGFSDGLKWQIHNRHSRTVKKEMLDKAVLVRDFIPGFPVNWITSYTAVEIHATCGGMPIAIVGPNEVLTREQKNILRRADLLSDLFVNVKYKYDDPVTHQTENNQIHIRMMVVPEIEAVFAGGHQEMAKYIDENIITKISATVPLQFQKGIVQFTIGEEGNVIRARISASSGDAEADRLLLEEIQKMPKWKPAENSKGEKVKQEFEFSVGEAGC
jgi:TonB family protein